MRELSGKVENVHFTMFKLHLKSWGGGKPSLKSLACSDTQKSWSSP